MATLERLQEILEEIVLKNTQEIVNNDTVQATYKGIQNTLREWCARRFTSDIPPFYLLIDCATGKVKVEFAYAPTFKVNA